MDPRGKENDKVDFFVVVGLGGVEREGDYYFQRYSR